jgi:5-methylcytosine-specific restriction endonuclease McrA
MSGGALAAGPAGHQEGVRGRLSYAKVRALTRIATPVTEAGLAEMAGPMTGVSAETPAPAPPPPGDPADPARCHVEDGPAVSVGTAHMLGCSAALSWMLHGRDGKILDLGRRRRRPNAALRKAARERDHGRCRFPGCESRRIDLHHIQHWAHGGRTSLDNLISLCKRHHMAVHDRGYLIATRDDGTFTIYDPGGIAIPPSPALPEPDGGIAGVHDADITPETIIPPWHGERLDLDNAIYTCLANERIQQDRAAGRPHPHPPVQIPTPV